MTRLLTEDVEQLSVILGDRSVQVETSVGQEANRRFYVRAIFALIEAVVEQHRLLLLELSRGAIGLHSREIHALSEVAYEVRKNGKLREKRQYLQLLRKLRLVYRCAQEAFGSTLNVDWGGQGWQALGEAVSVRDRITHPKTREGCFVNEDALETVDRGHEWFRELNNEFVRIARAHRDESGW